MNIKWLTWLAIAMAPSGAIGQVQSLSGNPPFQLNRPGRVQWHRVVKNNGTSALTAMEEAIQCSQTGQATSTTNKAIVDPFVNYGNDSTIPPGGSVEVAAGDPSQCNETIDAAIFADGHSEGTPEIVHNIYERRQGIYDSLPRVIEHLNNIIQGKETSQEVIQSLHELDKETARDTSKDLSRRLGSGFFLISVISSLNTLNGQASLNEQNSSANSDSSDQLKVQSKLILIRDQMERWHTDLKANLDPQLNN
jgi:hypothetical protein